MIEMGIIDSRYVKIYDNLIVDDFQKGRLILQKVGSLADMRGL